jgi:hypothetical protein
VSRAIARIIGVKNYLPVLHDNESVNSTGNSGIRKRDARLAKKG